MIEIEVCERLNDSWIDKDGNRQPKYHAQLKDHPGMWGCGRSPQSAIGSLIMNDPERFGLKLTELGKLPR